jgi:hypothetical protein
VGAVVGQGQSEDHSENQKENYCAELSHVRPNYAAQARRATESGKQKGVTWHRLHPVVRLIMFVSCHIVTPIGTGTM